MRGQNAPVGSPEGHRRPSEGHRRQRATKKRRSTTSAPQPLSAWRAQCPSPSHTRRGHGPAQKTVRPGRWACPGRRRQLHPLETLDIVDTALTASRSTQDELRASRSPVRETTGPGTGVGLYLTISDTAMARTVPIGGIEKVTKAQCHQHPPFSQRDAASTAPNFA